MGGRGPWGRPTRQLSGLTQLCAPGMVVGQLHARPAPSPLSCPGLRLVSVGDAHGRVCLGVLLGDRESLPRGSRTPASALDGSSGVGLPGACVLAVLRDSWAFCGCCPFHIRISDVRASPHPCCSYLFELQPCRWVRSVLSWVLICFSLVTKWLLVCSLPFVCLPCEKEKGVKSLPWFLSGRLLSCRGWYVLCSLGCRADPGVRLRSVAERGVSLPV